MTKYTQKYGVFVLKFTVCMYKCMIMYFCLHFMTVLLLCILDLLLMSNKWTHNTNVQCICAGNSIQTFHISYLVKLVTVESVNQASTNCVVSCSLIAVLAPLQLNRQHAC